MIIGDKYNSLEIETTINGFNIRILDGCDFCEYELTQEEANIVIQILNHIRCPHCGKILNGSLNWAFAKECNCRTTRTEEV